MGGGHDVSSGVEVVEDLFGWMGWFACRDFYPRRVKPVPGHANGFDFGRLGPFFDASGNEFRLGFAPDACGELGFGD